MPAFPQSGAATGGHEGVQSMGSFLLPGMAATATAQAATNVSQGLSRPGFELPCLYLARCFIVPISFHLPLKDWECHPSVCARVCAAPVCGRRAAEVHEHRLPGHRWEHPAW